MTVKDKLAATLRTVAAGVVSYALTWAAVHWHIVLSPQDSQLVQGEVFVVLLAVYHAGASAIQRRWPAWSLHFPVLGWLKGLVALLLITDFQPMGYIAPAEAFANRKVRAAANPDRRRSR